MASMELEGTRGKALQSVNPITHALVSVREVGWEWVSPNTLLLPEVGKASPMECPLAMLWAYDARQHRSKRLAVRVASILGGDP